MFFFYILKKFVKNFLLFLFSLSFLYFLITLIANFSKLPSSSNLQILYSFYQIGVAFENFYALSLLFAFLYTMYQFIKFNTLVSFYSLGFSKRKVLMPFLGFSFFIYFLFIGLENTNYAYFNQKAENILSNKKIKKENLFLKYKNNIIFIKQLNPILKKATDMEIFVLDNMKIKKIIKIDEAFYQNNIWNSKEADIKIFQKDKLVLKKAKNIKVLKDFEPVVLSNLKKMSSISIKDAFLALKIFKDIKLNKVISLLMFKIVTPVSLILFLVYLLYTSPIHQRISSISFFLIKSSFYIILLWGANLLLYKFIKKGIISPFMLFLPLVFVIILDIYVIKKEK